MTSSRDMTHDFECVWGVAFYISDRYKQDHNRVGRLVGGGVRSPADDALKVCAFKVPASAVGSPNLSFDSAAWKQEVTWFA